MDNIATNDSPNSRANKFIYFVLGLVLVGISVVQTAIGYTLIAGPTIAWMISGVIGVLLLLLDFQFFSRLEKREAIFGTVLSFLLVASFSFAGNFNAFYSQFMREELYDTELREYQDNLTEIQSRSSYAIQHSMNADSIAIKAEQLKTTMLTQIQNPGDPGWGPKTQQIAEEIELLLGTPLTVVNGTPQQIARNVGRQIDNMLRVKIRTMTQDPDLLSEEIQAIADSVYPVIQTALLPENVGAMGRSAIEKTMFAHNTIGEKTKKLIPGFEYEKLSGKNLQVGKMSHSFKSGFVDMVNPQSTLIATILSMAIDFLLPIIILLTVKRVPREEDLAWDSQLQSQQTIAQKGDPLWL